MRLMRINYGYARMEAINNPREGEWSDGVLDLSNDYAHAVLSEFMPTLVKIASPSFFGCMAR